MCDPTAAHLLDLLLERGYEVVTTVRTEDKAAKIREAHPGAKLRTAVVPDIAAADAFDAIVAQEADGLTYVQHTASPFHYGWTDARSELLDPALEGTRSILRAVTRHAPSVRRVVVTSSFAAVLSAEALKDPAHVFSEADWNPLTYEDGLRNDKGTAYRASKTVAERAAWDFVEKEKPAFDLVTINPPLVFGPLAHHVPNLAAVNTSNQRIVDLVTGKWRADAEIPASGVFLFVDVRDVARAHANALEVPDAGGKRFFVVAGHYSNRGIADIARKHFGATAELKDRLPDPDTPGGELPDPVYGFDNARATKVLGIEWIPFEKTVVDTINSLRALGAF